MSLPHPRTTGLLALGATTALVLSGLASLPAAQAATPATTTLLTSDVVNNLSASTVVGAVADTKPMRIAVAMTVNQAARDAAYRAIYTPGSPSYHAFYTPQTFNATFGVSQAAARRVSDSVTRDGLTAVYASPDGSYVELTGTAKQVEATFSVAENTYLGPTGKTFTANATAPTVPVGVSAVLGLTSLTTFTTDAKTAHAKVPTQGTCVPTQCTGELDPQDLWSIYDQPATDRGAGQKVAIFGEGQLDQVVSNLRTFEKDRKLPAVPVRRVLVGDDNTDNAGQDEWDLDSDASTGMAPDMQQLNYYFGSDLSDASIGGTYAAWANDPDGPLTGNSSFGGAEQLEYLGGFILDPILQQVAMEGRTMFVSAGDVGGSCLPGANGATNTGAPCVEYPASSPYVVGVGGTVLYSTADTSGTQTIPAARSLEYSWTYSGGGMSDFEAAPAYQAAAFPAGVGVPCAAGPGAGSTCRGVPDVSSVSGDITTNGYNIVSGTNGETSSGGTSLSSPLWAGMWSRVVAAHPVNGSCTTAYAGKSTSLGFAQPVLYAIGASALDTTAFFDVGGPTNSTTAGNGQQFALPRTPGVDPEGYDFVSGLGTPDIGVITKGVDCGATTPAVANVALGADSTTTGQTINYVSTAGCPANGTLVDPAGDQVPAVGTDEFDLRNVTITSNTTATTFSTTVTKLAATDPELDYAFEFTLGAGSYAVSVDHAPTGDTFELYQLAVTVTPTGVGVILTPTDLGPLTGSVNVATSTITAVLPFATFNKAAAPKVPYGLSSALTKISVFTQSGPAAVAIGNNYNVEPTDQANFFACPYLIANSAGAAGVSASGTTASSTAAAASSKKSAAKKSTKKVASKSGRSTVKQPTRTLAFTGLPLELPLGGLLLMGAALALGRRRRTRLG